MDTSKKQPTVAQHALIESVANTVNLVLSYWPPRSGKTVVRAMIAHRILMDDDVEPRKPIENPYL